MSKIALNSNASGSGVFTIESPNSDTDRTLNLPDKAGTVQVGEGIDDNATSTAITIDASQNVGIGTASPSDQLEVSSATPAILITDTDTSDTFRLKQTNTLSEIQASTDFAIDTNGTERMRITSSGNVGIGTTSPSDKLSVSVASNSGSVSFFGGTQSSRSLKFTATNTGGFDNSAWEINQSADNSGSMLIFKTRNAERLRIDDSGNLLVGTDTPINSNTIRNTGFVPLNVYRDNGNSTNSIAIFYSNYGGTQSTKCRIKGDGDLENTNNSYGSTSDARLKSNIVDASSQIDDIMAVQVRSYTLNETGDTHIGVVAQELEASEMSGLVKTDDEGMKSVKYSILYMKAIKALQEAVTRIETLEAEVAALKAGD